MLPDITIGAAVEVESTVVEEEVETTEAGGNG